MSKEELYVVGYPRSGNVWLARLLGRILNSEVNAGKPKPALCDEGAGRPGKYVIRQRHSRKPITERVVFLYRDPRDVAVSAMKYWQYNSLEELFYGPRRALMLFDDGAGSGWANFINLWLEHYKANALTSYEAMHADTFGELRNILNLFEIEGVEDETITKAVELETFQSRRSMITDKYPYGQTIQLRHMRKGVVGDWKNYFTRSLGEYANKEWWYWLEYFGYETEENWWESLPE